MKIKELTLHPYQFSLTTGAVRKGTLIEIIDAYGNVAQGEIAPLPGWSRETLNEAIEQIAEIKGEILKIDWSLDSFVERLLELKLYPSVCFGLESAILTILSPLNEFEIETSALFMGSVQDILKQAAERKAEGYRSAKLKVSQLSFDEANHVISELKDTFRLRIDVNRAWDKDSSLRFFDRYDLNAFDYVEEPFKNPKDLGCFKHPLAVDESFPQDLSFQDLESLPGLKAFIYKPTIQGGMTGCLPIFEWAKVNMIEVVISSSFESHIGLKHAAAIAKRLSLKAPAGLGTCHFMIEKGP